MTIERKYARVAEAHVRFTMDDVARAMLGEEYDPNLPFTVVIDDGKNRGGLPVTASLVITQFNRRETDRDGKEPADPPADSTLYQWNNWSPSL
ncbi:MAG: hypothetical protein KA761_00020 [Gemmatimonadaceae bacterium]|nr:hypothetical protein [Gemmatimonadaceae bacterium]